MTHYELIQFPDGQYGIREIKKFMFFKTYLGFVDFDSTQYRWSKNSCYFEDCKTYNKDKTEQLYNEFSQNRQIKVLKSTYK